MKVDIKKAEIDEIVDYWVRFFYYDYPTADDFAESERPREIVMGNLISRLELDELAENVLNQIYDKLSSR